MIAARENALVPSRGFMMFPKIQNKKKCHTV